MLLGNSLADYPSPKPAPRFALGFFSRQTPDPKHPYPSPTPLVSCHPLHTSTPHHASSGAPSGGTGGSDAGGGGGGDRPSYGCVRGCGEEPGLNLTKSGPPCFCLAFESTLDAVRFCHACQVCMFKGKRYRWWLQRSPVALHVCFFVVPKKKCLRWQ